MKNLTPYATAKEGTPYEHVDNFSYRDAQKNSVGGVRRSLSRLLQSFRSTDLLSRVDSLPNRYVPTGQYSSHLPYKVFRMGLKCSEMS